MTAPVATSVTRSYETAADTITLGETDRHRRRMAMRSDNGIEFLLDLPQARLLGDGDGLVLDNGRIVEVRAAPEPLYEVRGRDAGDFGRSHRRGGNRRLPAYGDPRGRFAEPRGNRRPQPPLPGSGQGEKIPRKGGPAITRSDLLIINKTDLAPHVGADLDVMRADTERVREGRPYVMTDLRRRVGLEEVINFIERVGGLAAFA